jgi:hypothetical protein
VPIRWVLVRDPSGEKEPQAFLCTDLDADPVDILRWFVRRWRVETTFEEARRHLGLETQRQWSDLAILRTTPALLGLFSLVTLWTTQLEAAQRLLPECVRWYPKHASTFSDALAPRWCKNAAPGLGRGGGGAIWGHSLVCWMPDALQVQ